jgi:hypothetical protein
MSAAGTNTDDFFDDMSDLWEYPKMSIPSYDPILVSRTLANIVFILLALQFCADLALVICRTPDITSILLAISSIGGLGLWIIGEAKKRKQDKSAMFKPAGLFLLCSAMAYNFTSTYFFVFLVNALVPSELYMKCFVCILVTAGLDLSEVYTFYPLLELYPLCVAVVILTVLALGLKDTTAAERINDFINLLFLVFIAGLTFFTMEDLWLKVPDFLQHVAWGEDQGEARSVR